MPLALSTPVRPPGSTAPPTPVLRRRATRPVLGLLLSTGLAAGLLAAVPTAASAVDATFFGAGELPTVAVSTDRAGVELGMRFTVASAGTVSAIRFYRGGTANAGPHTVSLWSSGGGLLARVPAGKETAAGWQQVTLPTPLPVWPGVTYTASYYAPAGGYSVTYDYFGVTRTRGSITVPRGGGVFRYGGGYPTQTYRYTNYSVDIVYSPTVTGPVASPTPSYARPTWSPAPAPSTTTPAPAPSTTTPAPPTSASATPSGGLNCAAKPSSCGYPDGLNTGVPAGLVLRRVPEQVTSGPGWHYDSRGWVSIDAAGTVFDGYDVSVNVDVNASNVTIKNTRIRVGGEVWGVGLRHASNVTIQDSEILAPDGGASRLMVGIKDIYGDATGTQVLRTEITGTSTGVQLDVGLVQDNYIHDMGYRSGDHINGITSNGGRTDLLTIRHNTVFNQFGQTDAVGLFQDFGLQANRVIDSNLLAGGGYTLYAGANPGAAKTSNIRVTNNRFARVLFSSSGSFGPVTAFDRTGTGNVWSGNMWDDSGLVVNP